MNGLYQVSNLGNVRSLKGKKEKIMKFTIRSGYRVLNLRKDGARKSKQIHRLVAEAFIENLENKPFVNHKDFNRQNNNIKNLEWVTQKENVRWSICNMKHKKAITHTNTGEKYIYFRKKYNSYALTIQKKYYGAYKTLEEAIKKRDDILNEVFNNTK